MKANKEDIRAVLELLLLGWQRGEKERGRKALRKQIGLLLAAIEHQNLQGGPNLCSCSLQELFGS